MSLKRTTRLTARTPMSRSTGLKRRTPLAEVGRRAQAKGRKPRKNTGPTSSTRELVLERDSGCVMCGCGPHGLQVHHRKPRRMGGRSIPEINWPSNLISLCPVDHAWVESRREEALDLGLLVRENDNPAEIPLVHHLYRMTYLNDDGSVTPVGFEGGDAA